MMTPEQENKIALKQVKLIRITVVHTSGESIVEFIRPEKIKALYDSEKLISDIINK